MVVLIRKVFQEKAVWDDLLLVLMRILHVGWNIVAMLLEAIKQMVEKFEVHHVHW